MREVLICTEKEESNGALVAVRDSGPRLDLKSVDRLFEAFHSTKVRGVGIGLTVCRSIIEAHGGRMWAGANEPRGASFQFICLSSATRVFQQGLLAQLFRS